MGWARTSRLKRKSRTTRRPDDCCRQERGDDFALCVENGTLDDGIGFFVLKRWACQSPDDPGAE